MEITKNLFIKIIPSAGMVLTTYKDGDDVKTFFSSTEVCLPLKADPSPWREISEEEAASLEAMKEEEE